MPENAFFEKCSQNVLRMISVRQQKKHRMKGRKSCTFFGSKRAEVYENQVSHLVGNSV